MINVTPTMNIFPWFDGQAKEAAEFYVSIFPDPKILNISYLHRRLQQYDK